MSTRNLVEFNEDIICFVLRYFDIRQIIKSHFNLICKAFHSAVNNPACYSQIHCHDWDTDYPYHDFYINLFKRKHYHRRFRNIEALQFDMCQTDEETALQLCDSAPTIISSMKKLEWVYFRDWNCAIYNNDPQLHLKILKQISLNDARYTLSELTIATGKINFELCQLIKSCINLKGVHFELEGYEFCPDFDVDFINNNYKLIKECFSHITTLSTGENGDFRCINGAYGAFFDSIIHENLEYLTIRSNPCCDEYDDNMERIVDVIDCKNFSKFKLIQFKFEYGITKTDYHHYINWKFKIFKVAQFISVENISILLEDRHTIISLDNWKEMLICCQMKMITLKGLFKQIPASLCSFVDALQAIHLLKPLKITVNVDFFCYNHHKISKQQQTELFGLYGTCFQKLKALGLECKLIFELSWMDYEELLPQIIDDVSNIFPNFKSYAISRYAHGARGRNIEIATQDIE
eukprot:377019_1